MEIINLDKRSFVLGMITAFSECVAGGCKRLALSPPLSKNDYQRFADETYDYEHWYIGGHSLGGAMAANFAASHGDQLTGLILLAAYPTKPLNKTLLEISIYGLEDGVLNMEKIEAGKAYAPEDYREYVITDGNHAQFGNYGEQRGDGAAAISSEEQQQMVVRYTIHK